MNHSNNPGDELESSPVYIIAEIGTSHQGNEAQLKALIDAAARSGADCAKFQWVIADEIIHPNTGDVPLPTGSIRLYDRFRELEVSPDFYRLARDYCSAAGIDFLCTPFGPASARGLQDMGVTAFKIASPELNHHPLLEQLAGYHKPLIVSSGVSSLADIDESIRIIRTIKASETGTLGKLPSLTLLHCITAYPAPEEDFNLLLIRSLSQVFGVPVGLSDHSLDPVLVPLISVLLGARIIEKHFTLSNSTDGLDDPIALDPLAFHKMVRAIRQAESDGSLEAIAGLRDEGALVSSITRVLQECGQIIHTERVRTILGTGIKELAGSERANYGRTNRSIHALGDLPRGHVLQENDFAVLRTEKVLRPGLHPRYSRLLAGRVLSQPVPSGEGIRWEDLA